MFPVYDLPIPPVCTTQNRRLETEDACTDDCPGLLTRSLLALKGTRSVVKLNHYHLFFDTTTT
jgi:hypothetical protein